ncbi:sugar transferase [Methylobacterium sp. GC_Met_2]|uniref:sugar transferase n=1 Tax=Methylobacterium sp. GC_Met_2 TaxID=2937376 RepID=UPI00226B8ADA|nr:sugar transferase [Methylobacterium sp. GC_Met_2]
MVDAIRRELISCREVEVAGSNAFPDSKFVLRLGFDVAIAAMILALLAPLLAVVALLIRVDSTGPALFRQTRTGRNGRTFLIYKFRTMHVQEDSAVVQQAQRGDARLTGLGGLLRKTSLDELPQLLNVLRGEMALVGPRPHALAHDRHYGALISTYHERFAVRPGITGWAQINGSRGATPELADMQRRIELDLWYVENRSLALNLKILFATALHILPSRSNAY